MFERKDLPKFRRSLKDLIQGSYPGSKGKDEFKAFIKAILEGLTQDPFGANCFTESWAHGRWPKDWQFYKYYFKMPGISGARGQGRIMYLVNQPLNLIVFLWIYTHEDYPKRPPDHELKIFLKEGVEEQPGSTPEP